MMNRIHIYLKHTPASIKRHAGEENRFQSRDEQWQKICNRVGVNLVGVFWNYTNSEVCIVVEGSVEKANFLQSIAYRSGGYSQIRQEVLIEAKNLRALEPDLMAASADFEPSDRDEIDRMLLGE